MGIWGCVHEFWSNQMHCSVPRNIEIVSFMISEMAYAAILFALVSTFILFIHCFFPISGLLFCSMLRNRSLWHSLAHPSTTPRTSEVENEVWLTPEIRFHILSCGRLIWALMSYLPSKLILEFVCFLNSFSIHKMNYIVKLSVF